MRDAAYMKDMDTFAAAGSLDGESPAVPALDLHSLMRRDIGHTDAERTLLDAAAAARTALSASLAALRRDASGALTAALTAALVAGGTRTITIECGCEEYGDVYWVPEADGEKRDDFDAFDVRVADLIKACCEEPGQVTDIPGVRQDGDELRWTFTAFAGAGCDSCGAADRVPGERFCHDCLTDLKG